MADIELVIKIPEEDLDAIKYLKAKGWASRHELLILKGARLPEGHGRLMDADDFIKMVEWISKRYKERLIDDRLIFDEAIIDGAFEMVIASLQNKGLARDDSPTIIEADAGE